MTSSALLLYFEDEAESARRIAAAAGIACLAVSNHQFPDGEFKLRLPDHLPQRVVILRGLDRPNEKLIELLLAARGARSLGAQHLTLVAPYLAYMRQDMAFAPGEVISQRIVGQYLASLFDALVTVDPHLHRVATLEQAVPVSQAITLSGAPLLADLIARLRPGALLVGPDEESAQWIAQAAARHGFDQAVCRKVRRGDKQVDIELPRQDFSGRAIVLMDDVASSGHTLAMASRLLLAAGAASVDVAVTHALFAHDALDVIQRSGIQQVWSTDCIQHSSNAISMAPAIAHALCTLDPGPLP